MGILVSTNSRHLLVYTEDNVEMGGTCLFYFRESNQDRPPPKRRKDIHDSGKGFAKSEIFDSS